MSAESPDDDDDFACADIQRMIAVVQNEGDKHICDALADQNLLPLQFRASALKAEHLTIGQVLNPENFAVVIYDCVTMLVDPWENIQLRGWEQGSPTPEQMLELQMQAEEIALDLEKLIDHPKPYLNALEKIKLHGLCASMGETVEALLHPLRFGSMENMLKPASADDDERVFDLLRSRLTPGLNELIEKFGEKEIETILVQRLNAMATKKQPVDGFIDSPAADALNLLNAELNKLRDETN